MATRNLDIIKDPVTGKQYSRDLSVQGSSYSEYTAPEASNSMTPKVDSLSNFGTSSKSNVSPEKTAIDKLNDRIVGTLGSSLDNLGSVKDREKSILEKFADRKKLASAGGNAERELINSESSDSIDAQLESNARSLIDFREQGRGYATQKVAMDYVADTGKKRVRELEKARDNLLLQSKVAEASRLDDLIAKEEEAITNARTSFINELTSIGSQAREIASFETPEQKRARDLETSGIEREREFEYATKTAIQTLAANAPDAGITSTDDYTTALSKYRNSTTYKRNEKLGELEIRQAEANISQSLASAEASRASASKSLSDSTTASTTGIADAAQISFLKDSVNKAIALANASGRSKARRDFEERFLGSTEYTQLESLIDTIKTNLLTLSVDPTIKKFFGPQMTNRDVALMTSAGTTLDTEKNDPQMMKDELNRVLDLYDRMEKALPGGSTGLNTFEGPQQPTSSSPVPADNLFSNFFKGRI